MHWKYIVALCGVMIANTAHAQANPDSVKMRNDCRLAAQVLTSGNPAPRLEWARGFIGYCGTGEWVAATRGAVLRLRTSTNDSELGREWRFVWMIRDADLFDTVLGIALDGRASTAARLWSLKTLAQYIDPNGSYYANPPVRSAGGRPKCTNGGPSAGIMQSYSAKPLPMNFAALARGAAETLIADVTQPVEIRNAAWCVRAAPVYVNLPDDAN
jgi:hypothetical protein